MFALLVLFISINLAELSNDTIPDPIDYLKIYSDVIPSSKNCQSEAMKIRMALKIGKPLENIPSQVITERNVSFHLYTRKNKFDPEILNTYDPDHMVGFSKFINFSGETIIYVPAANQMYTEPANQFVTNLLSKQDVNVIILNWDSYAYFNINYTRNFTTVPLSDILGQFLRQLIKGGADPENLYLIGFSVGGQAVGLAAKQISPKIGKILAIEPQGNCFNQLPKTKKLDVTDALFVQIIHCTVGATSAALSLRGNVTFYPNGGLIQPQCYHNSTVDEKNICSHESCDNYLFNSLKNFNAYVATKCYQYTDYLFRKCNCSDTVVMGYNTPTSAKGTYYINTQSSNHNLCQLVNS